MLKLLEPCFARNIRLGLAALLIWQVEILHARFRISGDNLALQFVAKLALLFDAGQDCCFALREFKQVRVALFDMAQLGIIQPACGFLAVTGDEGHGIALRQKLQRCLHLKGADVNFCRDGLCDSHSGKSSQQSF